MTLFTFAYSLFFVFMCTIAFDYSLYRLFGKKLPWYGDVVGGIVTSVAIIPVAIIVLILDLLGFRRFPLL